MDDRLISVIACPVCKGSVTMDDKRVFLICPSCSLKYPVIQGIPVMLADEAHPLEEDEHGPG